MATIDLPTTDITDTGNRPGDGPLRAGGVSQGEIRSADNLPSTRSPRSEEMLDAVTLCRDLWGGTPTVRAAGQTYLPKGAGEDSANYTVRLNRAVFFNAFRRTVEGLAGLVFRKDPALGEDVPEPIRVQWENIDNEGTHGDVWCRDRLVDTLAVGHGLILVEYPRTGGTQTRGDEIALELRPYWLPVLKEDIMSWRSEVINGIRVLTQLVLRERTWEPAGQFGERERVRYRTFYREAGLVGYTLTEVTEDKSVVLLDMGTYPTQDEIPVAEIRTSGSKGLLESDPPLLDLAYLNVAHYQQWADYAYGIYKTNVPMLLVAGVEIPEGSQEMVVGPNTSIVTRNPDAHAEYVAHTGAALSSSKASLDDLKADMGTLGLAMLAPQKRTAETAEAKRLDKSTSDSALAVTARSLQDAIEKALYFHARYLGLEDGGSVQINRDFEGLLMDAPVMGAFAQLVQAGFPARPVLEALQAGGRIGEDADLDELEMAWLGQQAAASLAADMEAELGT